MYNETLTLFFHCKQIDQEGRGFRNIKIQDLTPFLLTADFRDDLLAAKQRYFTEVELKPELMNKLLERYERDGFMGLATLQIQQNAG